MRFKCHFKIFPLKCTTHKLICACFLFRMWGTPDDAGSACQVLFSVLEALHSSHVDDFIKFSSISLLSCLVAALTIRAMLTRSVVSLQPWKSTSFPNVELGVARMRALIER